MALGTAQLFRWRSNTWQAGGKAGRVLIAVDVNNGIGTGKISLAGGDNTASWWRDIALTAAVTIEAAIPQRALIANGAKQFALLFEDKENATRFSKKFAEAVLELRAAKFTVVKTKALLEMARELERLKAENKALNRRSGDSPLRASAPAASGLVVHVSPPSDSAPRPTASSASRPVRPPILKARALRLPLDTVHPAVASLKAAPLGSPSTTVDAIVSNVARNSIIRLSGAASLYHVASSIALLCLLISPRAQSVTSH